MSINFYLGESVKYGKSPIVIRVQYRKAGINIRRNTGFSMEPDIWKNRFNIQCLKKYAWIDEIQNTFIQLSKIAQTITVMHHEGIHITTDVVKECMFKIKYKEYLAEADEKTFMPFYRYLDQLYIDFNEGKRMTENGTPYRRGTLTSIKQAYDHYKAFEKKSRRKFDYDDINMDFYNKYTNILNDAPYLQKIVANVSLLVKAATTRKKVLVEYESNWRNRRCRLIIEPYSFYFYFNYVWCFEGNKRKNTALRISRMTEVQILDDDWPCVPKHRKQVIDAFGCWGHKMKPVKLRLTMQARNLMTEAHPISMITMREDTDYPDGEKWILETGVCDYSGITRYIMGMLDEVEILEGDGLKEYIRAWREKIDKVVL